MAMKTYERLSAARFDALRPYLNPRIANIEAARAIMVDGESARQVAARLKKTSESIRQSCRAIWQTHLKVPDNAPPGWVRFEVCLPQELVQVVKDMEANARKRQADRQLKGVNDENSGGG